MGLFPSCFQGLQNSHPTGPVVPSTHTCTKLLNFGEENDSPQVRFLQPVAFFQSEVYSPAFPSAGLTWFLARCIHLHRPRSRARPRAGTPQWSPLWGASPGPRLWWARPCGHRGFSILLPFPGEWRKHAKWRDSRTSLKYWVGVEGMEVVNFHVQFKANQNKISS